VSRSVIKLLSRIVAPDNAEANADDEKLHDTTFKITSDPLTRFACVFSALVHDVGKLNVWRTANVIGLGRVDQHANQMLTSILFSLTDHIGVSNVQLVNENARTAAIFRGKSVAEQVGPVQLAMNHVGSFYLVNKLGSLKACGLIK